jgi:hypothetical protein
MQTVDEVAVDMRGGGSDSEGSTVELHSPYPCSLLWTPIHPITWLLPFVGHLGVTDSSGALHDWGGGPIRACRPKHMMFGEPARYIPLHPRDKAAWDDAIARADDEYLHYIHCMVCGSDCHSHVARVLNLRRVGGFGWHNKVILAAWVFFCGRHIGVQGVLTTLGARTPSLPCEPLGAPADPSHRPPPCGS